MFDAPISIDAILYKFATRQITIVLKHDCVTYLDVEKESEVQDFLKHLDIIADPRGLASSYDTFSPPSLDVNRCSDSRYGEIMASLLLNLPGEIRNRVYTLVLEHDAAVTKIKHKKEFKRLTSYNTYDSWEDMYYGRWSRKKEEAGPPNSYAGLTRVCRQIREEYLPSSRAVWNVMYAGYDDLVDLPAILLNGHTHRNILTGLEIRVRTTDMAMNSHVDLLPILRASANPQTGFRCGVDKYEKLNEELYLGYLLLYRILEHKHKDWLAMLRESAFVDAILFNLTSRDIKIVLGHKGAAYIDGENASQVRNLLESMEVVKETRHSGTLVLRISGASVSVTQSPASEDV
ncbi:uncharacterized protein N0V89_011230 [Didymosphaeria variabile]|uniref:Uncharacterized protein n=1 Tax=Didymosphaeria variabile TaxID=1932322 RepID=A0A9W8XD49_9PLEO|nr:uncharacterized protein N0V89_011230 [Didymosphaeria variabile]KAJ4347290.1 hypothetical protein N0V89_011230 [Didymosphaeria variabile]